MSAFGRRITYPGEGRGPVGGRRNWAPAFAGEQLIYSGFFATPTRAGRNSRSLII